MKTILVTGATSGVGLALTEQLLAMGHRVVMSARDLRRGEAVRADLSVRYASSAVHLEQLDLLDLSSVRALARRKLEVDVLVNNAGIAFEPKLLSPEGVVSQLATNHFGHFALTALLFPQLSKRAEPRVVTVTSTLAQRGRIHLDNLDGSRGYSAMRAYRESKLANVLFAAELDRRLRTGGHPMKSVLVHPGVPSTAMQQKATGAFGLVARVVAACLGKPPLHGAAAVAHAALAPEVQGGSLWEPGSRIGAAPSACPTWPSMRDVRGAAALWACSERVTGVNFSP